MDQADVALFERGEEITLMAWGNAFVRHITKSNDGFVTDVVVELHLEGDVAKTDKTIRWLAAHGSDLVQAELWEFENLLTKDSLDKDDDFECFLNPNTATTINAVLDSNSVTLAEGNFIQLERKGYLRVHNTIKKGPYGKIVLVQDTYWQHQSITLGTSQDAMILRCSPASMVVRA